MTTYDDKTTGIVASDGRFVLPHCIDCDDVTFKASYIVVSNIKCKGKITALFDLIVVGDLEANEIDVKGRFICMGKCKADTIIVYDEIWSEEITAISIETNSSITAQALKAKTIIAEGSILIARTLDIDSTAESKKAIICGETAFGSGIISTPTLFTGEPLDLDDGEDAVFTKDDSVNLISRKRTPPADCHIDSTPEENLIQLGEKNFVLKNDYCGYLDFVISMAHDEERVKFKRWKTVLSEVELNCLSIDNCTNAAQLIWLSEIAGSDHFRNWPSIDEMFIMFDQHFVDLMHDNADGIVCTINSYSELLRALSILHLYGDIISKEVYCWIYEQLISNLGLKSEFVHKRLNEKGWSNHA
jgi:hypothetical protein